MRVFMQFWRCRSIYTKNLLKVKAYSQMRKVNYSEDNSIILGWEGYIKNQYYYVA